MAYEFSDELRGKIEKYQEDMVSLGNKKDLDNTDTPIPEDVEERTGDIYRSYKSELRKCLDAEAIWGQRAYYDETLRGALALEQDLDNMWAGKYGRKTVRYKFNDSIRAELKSYLDDAETGKAEGELSEAARNVLLSYAKELRLRKEVARAIRDGLDQIAKNMDKWRVGCPEMVELIHTVADERIEGLLWEMTPGTRRWWFPKYS
jgi:hypothetical protein